jgi:hypothetical protein
VHDPVDGLEVRHRDDRTVCDNELRCDGQREETVNNPAIHV